MKIDTLEKLEILMLGLNAGRELNFCLERSEQHALYFGDFEGAAFTIDCDGQVNNGCIDDGMKGAYAVMGCRSYANKEARDAFNTIRINAGKKS